MSYNLTAFGSRGFRCEAGLQLSKPPAWMVCGVNQADSLGLFIYRFSPQGSAALRSEFVRSKLRGQLKEPGRIAIEQFVQNRILEPQLLKVLNTLTNRTEGIGRAKQ